VNSAGSTDSISSEADVYDTTLKVIFLLEISWKIQRKLIENSDRRWSDGVFIAEESIECFG
jgi:hypothetical protein